MTAERPTLAAADQAYGALGRAVVTRDELARQIAEHVSDRGSDASSTLDLAVLVANYRRAREAATDAQQRYSAAIKADREVAFFAAGEEKR